MWSGVGTLLSALLLASVITPGSAFAFEAYQTVKRALSNEVFAATCENTLLPMPLRSGAAGRPSGLRLRELKRQLPVQTCRGRAFGAGLLASKNLP